MNAENLAAAAPGTTEILVEGERPAPASASHSERSRDVLSLAPHRSGSDLLLAVPGLFIGQHGGEGKAHQIFFRGFDAAHGQDLEVWVGATPVNDVSNLHGQGYADLHFVIPETVARVLSSGGPYEARQGDFAVAGSVRYELGVADPGFVARASAGSFGTQRYALTYRPSGPSEATFGAVEYYTTDGFGPARAAERASAIGQIALALGDAALRVTFTSYAGRFDSAGLIRESDVDSGRVDRFRSYDRKQGGRSGRTSLAAVLVGFATGWAYELAPFLVLRDLALRQNYTGFLRDPLEGDRTLQTNDALTVGARGSLRKSMPWGSLGAIEAGFLARHDSVEQSESRVRGFNQEPTVALIDAEILASAVSGYVEARAGRFGPLTLRAGARLDGLATRSVDNLVAPAARTRWASGARLSKRGSASVRLTREVDAVLSYGEGIRSPQARLLADGERSPFTHVDSQELGLRYTRGSAFALGAALFRTALSDDLVFDERTGRNEPAPATTRFGAVVDLTARPAPGFISAIGAACTRARFSEQGGRYRSGESVPYVPGLVVRSDVGYGRELARVFDRPVHASVGGALSYAGFRALPFSEQGRDVLLFDIRARARRDFLELGVDVENLLDAEWYDSQSVYPSRFNPAGPASLVPERHVSAGPPRRLSLTLAVHL